LWGGLGNDLVDGGAGMDMVRFGGSRWEYQVSWDAATRSYTVVGASGTTTVTGVEQFQFGWETYNWSNLVAGAGDGLILVGTTGNDMLQGSAGYDSLNGGKFYNIRLDKYEKSPIPDNQLTLKEQTIKGQFKKQIDKGLAVWDANH